MEIVPTVTEEAIEARVGTRGFRLGQEYAANGAIFDCLLGMTIRARCRGSQGGPYRVEATLDAGGIATALCSCPVGEDAACKHAAALLLTWL